jgi:predicted acyl esterase
MRMRYLSGWRTPSHLKPGVVYRAEISLNPIAHRFEKGERLGLILRSDDFPAYARNTNTGAAIASDVETVVAHQEIHHSNVHPSALHLRVLSDGDR